MAVLKNPLMGKKIDVPYSDDLRGCIRPVWELVTYVYQPKSKADKATILKGGLPADMASFFSSLRAAVAEKKSTDTTNLHAYGDIPYGIRWFKDKKNPFIEFTISKIIDEKYWHDLMIIKP